jgi:non-canonical (house-cleaning) NTP pyrophosphatase
LTNNVIDRVQLYEHAMILALIPFKNESLYKQHGAS